MFLLLLLDLIVPDQNAIKKRQPKNEDWRFEN